MNPKRKHQIRFGDVVIYKGDFERYEKVKVTGATNMYSPDVQWLADLTVDQHLAIMQNYEKLMEAFPDVREKVRLQHENKSHEG